MGFFLLFHIYICMYLQFIQTIIKYNYLGGGRGGGKVEMDI